MIHLRDILGHFWDSITREHVMCHAEFISASHTCYCSSGVENYLIISSSLAGEGKACPERSRRDEGDVERSQRP